MNEQVLSRLVNVKRQFDGSIDCGCPQCILEGSDSAKNHLKIYKSGAFICAKYKEDKDHNKKIYSLVYKGIENDSEFIDQTPPNYNLSTVKYYSEETLNKLIKDHTYWVNRNVSIEVLEKLEGGLAPINEKNKLSGRYCFPIRDINGKIVGFSGRLVKSNELSPKWKHIFRVKEIVYPYNIAKSLIKECKIIILVESIGDCLALMTYGIENVLVLFSTNISSRLIGTLIACSPLKIIISTNNDKDKIKNYGKLAAEKIYTKLLPFFDESILEIYLPEAKDWGEASKDDFDKLKSKIVWPVR